LPLGSGRAKMRPCPSSPAAAIPYARRSELISMSAFRLEADIGQSDPDFRF
jgi:hypothetical protein